mmetsp:Transcript_7979/g.32375  ORF Transcript_7979/g.32375 Transcript_7979/m.32375 type:complete len:212 (+) Transcript_7979:1116-1751(+)
MIPTSATTLSSSSNQASSPSSPFSPMSGALFVPDLKLALPRPPRPPATSSARSPGRSSSATKSSPRSLSSTSSSFARARRTMVPQGTKTVSSPPSAPCDIALPPDLPGWARKCSRLRKGCSELIAAPASTYTEPPAPPLPPFGPPCDTNFSRRKETMPSPPSPLRVYIFAVSKYRSSYGSACRSRCVPSSSSKSSPSSHAAYPDSSSASSM